MISSLGKRSQVFSLDQMSLCLLSSQGSCKGKKWAKVKCYPFITKMSTFTIKNTAVSQSLCLNNQQEIIKKMEKLFSFTKPAWIWETYCFTKLPRARCSFFLFFSFFFFAGKYAYSNVGYGKIVGCSKVQDMLRKYRNLDVDERLDSDLTSAGKVHYGGRLLSGQIKTNYSSMSNILQHISRVQKQADFRLIQT